MASKKFYCLVSICSLNVLRIGPDDSFVAGLPTRLMSTRMFLTSASWSTQLTTYRWMIASSMIQLGLSWWQAWICVWLGYGIVAPFIALNARPGAIFHVTFPVVARTSFGLYGSLWCTFNRGAMACIWYGVQASIGGDCVKVMLRAIWPSINNIREFVLFTL